VLKLGNCTFNTGKPTQSWNDCYRCLVNDNSIRKHCQGRWYLRKDGPDAMDHECLDFSMEMISRGLYAAQIAWWLEFFPPEQFVFINSDDLFANPVQELNKVADLIGLNEPFTEEMISRGSVDEHTKVNAGKYTHFHDDPDELEAAKAILRDYFDRANEDLYALLRANGHDFPAFTSSKKDNTIVPQGSINDMLM